MVEEIMKRVEVNDPASILTLANSYHNGRGGLQQDHARAIELYAKAAELGCSKAHFCVGELYEIGGDLKKAKFRYEAAATAGHEEAKYSLGCMDHTSGHQDRALKHWKISASAGYYNSMQILITLFEQGVVSRDSIDSTLTSYNNSCAEMRSEARNAAIRMH
jgi:TPR repeat protein